MKKNKVGIIAICVGMLLCVTGCLKKTVITAEIFTTKMENNGYTVTNISDQYKSYDYVENVLIAQSEDGYQVEFYDLASKDDAKKLFNNNRSTFEELNEGSSTEVSVNMINYSTYALTSGDCYMYISRVDDTFLYVKVNEQYKANVKDIVEELGY